MASYLTSDSLIDSVKRKAHIPISQSTFTNDDILAFANEEIQIGLVPSVLKMHEEFFVYSNIQPLVQTTSTYEIPPRAIGAKCREVFFQDSSTNLHEMSRINPDDVPYYQNTASMNYPRVFYVENNSINILPQIQNNPLGILIIKYFMRPNQLVDSDRVCTITAVNMTTGDISVDLIPSVFSLTATCDLMQQKGLHKTLAIDLLPTSLNLGTNVINFNPASFIDPITNLPIKISVGDIVSLSGETIIPQLPDELHTVLAQRTVCRCLEAQKDTEGLQAANAKLQEMETQLGIIIDNRIEGSPKKVTNLRGPLRMGKFRRRRSTW